MNIQLSIADPDNVAEPEATIVIGILQSHLTFKDYSVQKIAFDTAYDSLGLVFEPIQNDETLLDRDIYGDLSTLSFHNILTRPVWNKSRDRYPSGEIAILRTDIPYQPEGLNSYVVFGIVFGPVQNLKPFSSRIYQAENISPLSDNSLRSTLSPTDERTTHTNGNHLTLPLTYPVWGFGEKKVGMRSPISDAENNRMTRARHLIVNSESSEKDIEEAININPFLSDTEYTDYLKYTSKCREIDGFRDALWVTKDQIKAFKVVASKYARMISPDKEMTP